MNFETIKMEIASNPQYVSIVRLTTSGIANKVGFCLDDIEDMKVAVSEACTNAIKHRFIPVLIKYRKRIGVTLFFFCIYFSN